MDEFEEDNLELDTHEDIEDDGQGEAVDLPEDEEGGEEEHEEGGQPEDAGRERAKQSHEDNAAAKAARIRAQRETEERVRKELDQEISGMRLVNPYTGKPFGSAADLKDYAEKFQRDQDEEVAKKTGRTAEEIATERENREYIARKRQEEAQQRKTETEQEAQQRFLAEDLGRFVEQHPTVDISKLEQNAKFRKFAGNRLYKEPLAELYNDFLEIVGETERAATAKAASKQERSTGGGTGGDSVHLSPKQERDLDAWNRANPRMKMTAKEFLSM